MLDKNAAERVGVTASKETQVNSRLLILMTSLRLGYCNIHGIVLIRTVVYCDILIHTVVCTMIYCDILIHTVVCTVVYCDILIKHVPTEITKLSSEIVPKIMVSLL